jgi:hypothetical protein
MVAQRKDDIELMQHSDGELVLADVDNDLKLAALAELRDLVAGNLEAHADAVPDHKFVAMWREVGKGIDEATPKSIFGKLTAWIERHRGHVVTGMVSAGAVAAIALVMRPGSSDDVTPNRSLEVLPAAMRAAPIIESLDTPDGSGTVMNFEDEDGHTTVIWVTPADTVEGI